MPKVHTQIEFALMTFKEVKKLIEEAKPGWKEKAKALLDMYIKSCE